MCLDNCEWHSDYISVLYLIKTELALLKRVYSIRKNSIGARRLNYGIGGSETRDAPRPYWSGKQQSTKRTRRLWRDTEFKREDGWLRSYPLSIAQCHRTWTTSITWTLPISETRSMIFSSSWIGFTYWGRLIVRKSNTRTKMKTFVVKNFGVIRFDHGVLPRGNFMCEMMAPKKAGSHSSTSLFYRPKRRWRIRHASKFLSRRSTILTFLP